MVVVGDVMVDVSVAAGALALGGDVHGQVRLRPAGSGANAAVWAADAGAAVRLYGRVGADLTGRLLEAAVRDGGVEATLAVDDAARTGAMLVVREQGERSMVADRGANARLAPADLPETLEADAVLVSGYLLFHPGSEAAARAALQRAEASLVAVEAASWPLLADYGRDRFFAATAPATLLLANAREAEVLTDRRGEVAAEELAERYGAACVKRGRDGAILATRQGGVAAAPAPPVQEVDPTGAGDAFDGVLLTCLARGDDPASALAAACSAGARAAASDEVWPERR